MKHYDQTIQATARDLARLLRSTRRAYPDTPWREPWRPTPAQAGAFRPDTARKLAQVITHRRAGMAYREIADLIGMTENGVVQLVRSARQRSLWPDDLAPGRLPKASEP